MEREFIFISIYNRKDRINLIQEKEILEIPPPHIFKFYVGHDPYHTNLLKLFFPNLKAFTFFLIIFFLFYDTHFRPKI